MQVREIMSADVALIGPDTTIRDAARKMREENVGALPVGENDRLVGMVTDRDIAMRGVAEDRPPGNCSVRDVMAEGVFYCFEDVEAEEAAGVMAEHQVRRLPVLDRDKRLVGMLSLADLARADIPEAEVRALKSVSQPSQQPRA